MREFVLVKYNGLGQKYATKKLNYLNNANTFKL